GEAGLMGADGDGAAFPRGGALGCQRAGAAGRPEPGGPGVAFTAADADGHGNARRAGDGLAAEIDGEAVLREVAFHRGRRLHFDAGVDAGLFHLLEEVAGAVGGIAVARRLVLARDSGRALAAGTTRGPARGAGLTAGHQVSEQACGRISVPGVTGRDP